MSQNAINVTEPVTEGISGSCSWVRKGEKHGHLGGTQHRAAAPLDPEEPDELAQASG